MEFPSQAVKTQLAASAVRDCKLAGFENTMDGLGVHFNFILSNGMRTQGRDNTLYTTHMMPENVKTKKVQIH